MSQQWRSSYESESQKIKDGNSSESSKKYHVAPKLDKI
jgi:hypothetical protein